MRTYLRQRADSFRWAWSGLRYLWRSQPNARLHGLATLLVAALAAWLRLSAQDWALLTLSIGLVWVAEAFNTALERAVDLAAPGPHPLARLSKDVAAAAVLLAALTAAAVGLWVLGPPLAARLGLGTIP